MDEVRAVLDAPDVTTRLGLRDRAMLHLCFAGGLRVSELVGLSQENVTLQPSPSILVFGKGRRERSLPLWKKPPATCEPGLRYAESHRRQSCSSTRKEWR